MTTQETTAARHAASLEDYRWLTSAAAVPWLRRAADSPQSVLKLTAELRKQLSPAQTHLVLEQVELRRRAQSKFTAAAGMFFTPQGLEQATDETVAAYKAARFPSAAPVADLCCGIGGDLQALAARGPVIGVDRDPGVAVLAAANLRVVENEAPCPPHPQPLSHKGRGEDACAADSFAARSFPATGIPDSPLSPRAANSPLSPRGRGAGGEGAPGAAGVVVAEVADFEVRNFAAWHIDPDRRPHGRRTTRVELHDPGPGVIDHLRAACPAGAVKLAPAATLPDAWPREAELEWISRAGECRQLICWFGELARTRSAPGHDRCSARAAAASPSAALAKKKQHRPRRSGQYPLGT